jgi:pyridoxine 5-phosphate synthase
MTRLSVNINKVATLRNARGGNNPDLRKTAVDIQAFGAEGITIHPRPDQRHIRFDDVHELKELVYTEFNIEGNPNPDFVKMVLDVKPTQVTLVPDGEDALTSNAGWNCIEHRDFLRDVVASFKEAGIRTSVFLDPVEEQVEAAKVIGTERIELYTENYASMYSSNKESAINPYVRAANLASKLGLGLNAGHDLDLKNLNYFAHQIGELKEVSIGHALICDALYYGLENTIKLYLNQLNPSY